MVNLPVTLLIAALFVIVGSLLGYGIYTFGRPGGGESRPAGRQVNMRREVIWTGLAAGLLLAAFLYAR